MDRRAGSNPGRRSSLDFYEIQERQKAKSLAVFALIVVLYVFAFGVLLLIGWFAVGAMGGRMPFAAPGSWLKFWAVDAAAALLVAALQYADARKFAGTFILKRLGAKAPDRSDRYHAELDNAVEEARLAAGLPKVRAYVLPDWSVNSLAVIESDGTPAVAVTEGMLAEFTRDEIEAVAAHETAHIARGDSFYLTLICSMANFFERLREALEPDVEEPAGPWSGRSRQGGSGLAAFAALSAFVVRALGLLVSREREVLADAAAVELGRSPAALARAIYKASVHNSFVGDFNRTYGPLFIVSPRPRGETEGFFGRLTSTHPPVMERIGRLAEMAHLSTEAIIAQIGETRRDREKAKLVFPALEECRPAGASGPAPCVAGDPAAPFFGLCPRCREPLSETFYEGVPVQVCGRCLGKIVRQDCMDRILARTEIGFSPALLKKADEFSQRTLRNPLKAQRRQGPSLPAPRCPACGYGLASRPYNYQYFVPVERCLSCERVWFDADELEILQILVERAKAR